MIGGAGAVVFVFAEGDGGFGVGFVPVVEAGGVDMVSEVGVSNQDFCKVSPGAAQIAAMLGAI